MQVKATEKVSQNARKVAFGTSPEGEALNKLNEHLANPKSNPSNNDIYQVLLHLTTICKAILEK